MRLISVSSSLSENSPLQASVSLLSNAGSAKAPVSNKFPTGVKRSREQGDGIAKNGSVRNGRDKSRIPARQRQVATGATGWRISALIAEDEPLAQEALKAMLKHEEDVEVVAISATGREALSAINKLNPDLVFMDIEMPELNGFDVLSQIRHAQKPAVIFVSADETAAARAFDVDAIDYLVKPCRRDRLQSALGRARERLRQRQARELHQKLDALIAGLRQEPKSAERIAMRSKGRIVFLRLADINWAEAADNYVKLHLGEEAHTFRETMNALEARLSPKRFVRISRSAMVNIEQIKELQPMPHGEYEVVLRNGTKLTLTRGYREKLRELSLM